MDACAVAASAWASPGRRGDVSLLGRRRASSRCGGKIFAIARLAAEPPQRISLKCEPELAAQLRADHPAITPGYHLNKRHWNTVAVDGSAARAALRDMVEDSYDLVVSALPKRDAATISGGHDAPILVTGATDGLGRVVAGDLARRGMDVLVHGRSAERAQAVAEEIGAAGVHLADFSSLAEVRALAEELPRLDVLVNNAGPDLRAARSSPTTGSS